MSDNLDTRVEARWVGPGAVSVNGVVLDPLDPESPTTLVGEHEATVSDNWEIVKPRPAVARQAPSPTSSPAAPASTDPEGA